MNNLSHINRVDRISRVVISTALLFGVLAIDTAPAWLALVAAYLTLSAIIGRDVVYAAIGSVAKLIPRPRAKHVAAYVR